MPKLTPETSRKDMIAEAQKGARKLQRPWSVSPAKWATVQRLLIELAYHVPHVFPSQRRLATDLGTYRCAIQRDLDIAEAHGFIERREHTNDQRFNGTEYRLLWWSGHTPLSGTSGHISRTQCESKPLDSMRVQRRTQSESQSGDPSGPNKQGVPPIVSDPTPPRTTGPEGNPLPNLYPGSCLGCDRPLVTGEGRRGTRGSSPWCHECAEGKPSTYCGDRQLDKIIRDRERTRHSMDAYVPPSYGPEP